MSRLGRRCCKHASACVMRSLKLGSSSKSNTSSRLHQSRCIHGGGISKTVCVCGGMVICRPVPTGGKWGVVEHLPARALMVTQCLHVMSKKQGSVFYLPYNTKLGRCCQAWQHMMHQVTKFRHRKRLGSCSGIRKSAGHNPTQTR